MELRGLSVSIAITLISYAELKWEKPVKTDLQESCQKYENLINYNHLTCDSFQANLTETRVSRTVKTSNFKIISLKTKEDTNELMHKHKKCQINVHCLGYFAE